MTEQLAGIDAAFLALETPEMPMHVVGVLLLDPSAGQDYSPDRLRQVIRDRLHRMPPFLRRPVEVPLQLDKPYWHYETDVDLDQHVFDDVLEAPGDLHALGRWVGALTEKRLDRDKPLWELHVLTGLADGRVALVAKVHHSTLYGAAGAEFIAELLDLAPEPQPEQPRADVDDVAPTAPPGLLRRTVVAQVRRPLAVGRLLVRGSRGAVGAVRGLGGAVRLHGREALPPVAPRLPISGEPTPRRETAFAALSLDDAKRVKDTAGVKLNDVVLAVVAMALHRYLERRNELPDRPIVAGVPVNAGEGETTGTNVLATMLVSLPVDVSEPKVLLDEVHAATKAAKAFTAAVGPTALAELAEVTPPGALSLMWWLGRNLGLVAVPPPLLNVVVSNVMGPPIPLYLAGARVDAIYPLGPLLPGAGMNLTVLSNLDRLDVGVMACPDLVEDVWEFVDAMPGCLAELVEALS